MKLRNLALGFRAYQAIAIEAQLLTRIGQSTKGFFFNDRYQVGIMWSKTSGIMHDCMYYVYEDPSSLQVGQWGYDQNCKVWKSPSFKVSSSDIDYMAVLDARLPVIMTTMLNDEPKSLRRNLPAVMELASVWYCSTWRTSTFVKDQRFIVTRTITGSDARELVLGLKCAPKKLRGCDYLLLRLNLRYARTGGFAGRTPLFGFDLRWQALEKDMTLGFHWHQRAGLHATACMKKLMTGVRDEYINRHVMVSYYERQATFMHRLATDGCRQDDFDRFMSRVPKEAGLCVPVFVALTSLVEEELSTAAATQSATSFSINGMVSDRGVFVKEADGSYRSSKVCNELSRLVTEHKARGPYELIYKMLHGKKIVFDYGIGPKDAAKSDREIASQVIEMRPFQFFSECLQSTVSHANDDDALLNSDKYPKIVSSFQQALSSNTPVIGTSEDRKFHCGENHPEFMSVATSIIARVIGSPALVTSAAIEACNTTRHIVFPVGYGRRARQRLDGEGREVEDLEMKKLVEELEALIVQSQTDFVKRKTGKQFVEVMRMKLFKHMQQGIKAIAAGNINSIHVRGFAKAIMRFNSDIIEYVASITSDDVGAVAVCCADADVKKQAQLIVYLPCSLLHLTMQHNSPDKHVVSDSTTAKFIEMNDISITDRGMISQSPIHPCMSIQPLSGTSMVHDLMNVVSTATMTIRWSDPPVVAEASLNQGIRMLQNKWLLTSEEVQTLKDGGLIPRSLPELLGGFMIRDDETLNAVIHRHREEDIQDVIDGRRNIMMTVLRQSRIKNKKPGVEDEEKEYEDVPGTGRFSTDIKIESINQSRKIGGQVKNALLSVQRPSLRRERTAQFVKTFRNHQIQHPRFEEVKNAIRQPRVFVHFTDREEKDQFTHKMGVVAYRKIADRRRIMARRFLNITYRTPLDLEEVEISELPDDEFRTRMIRLSRERQTSGHTHTSPVGLPAVRIIENDTKMMYTRPQSFNFSYELEGDERPYAAPMYRNSEIKSFKVCLIGGPAVKTGSRLAYATGWIGDKMFAFYQFLGRRQSGSVDITAYAKLTSVVVPVPGAQLYVQIKEDWSPIFGAESDPLPGVHGDFAAVTNYGGMLRNRQGFLRITDIFAMNDSGLPSWTRQHFPAGLRFMGKPVEVPCESITFSGSKYVSRVRLVEDIFRRKAVVDVTSWPVIVRYPRGEVDAAPHEEMVLTDEED